MGYTGDLTTGKSAWHQMGWIKSKTPAQESAPPSRSLVLRPEPVECSAYAEHPQEGTHESASITTENSHHMIIRKIVSSNVQPEWKISNKISIFDANYANIIDIYSKTN